MLVGNGVGASCAKPTTAACAVLALLAACGGPQRERSTRVSSWSAHVYERGGLHGDALAGLMLRHEVCQGEDLRPYYGALDEADLIRFLERQRIEVSVERPRADLAYVTLSDSSGRPGLRLRVAILPSADEAGIELGEAIAQHGRGSWGVHRSNLAVLGPVDDVGQVVSTVAVTKLACWGVFTIAGVSEVYVIPGGYREL